jgi:hypothetical protein
VSGQVGIGVRDMNGFPSVARETVFGMQIDARFNGPPTTGNGGWSAGCFARFVFPEGGARPIEVTLRLPPPLGTELREAGGQVLIGDEVIAQVLFSGDVGEGVAPVPLTAAVAASRAYGGFAGHPFPTCYVCGPQRADGLRIFAGPVGDGRTAAPWAVPADVAYPTMWAALDCPGGWSAIHVGRTYVLGRMTAAVDVLPEPGSTCVVVGRTISMSGRKALVDSSVYGPAGDRLATARSTWIAV